MKLIQTGTSEQIELARELFKDYEVALGISLCFQNFEKELAELPGDYTPPDGRLILAFDDGELAGCVALRKLNDGICEMKRLFVRPAFQGKGLGRNLIDSIIREAKAIGYERMRLDTLPLQMNKAIALYRAIGFQEIDPYYANPVPGALFMELRLSAQQLPT